jgi:hypothetical protein
VPQPVPNQTAVVATVENLATPRGRETTEERGLMWQVAQFGIDECRRGQWKSGLAKLSVIEEIKTNSRTIPGLALTYLGYGIASQDRRVADGLRYCRAGVDRESWQPENHFNLARTYLLAGNVKRAIAALDYGLGLDPTHSAMLDLRHSLGVRRPPTFSFLNRGHLLNRIAGRLRHQLSSARALNTRDVSELDRAQV